MAHSYLFLNIISLLSLCGGSHSPQVLVYDKLFTSEHVENIRSFFREVSWEFKPIFAASACPESPRIFQCSLPVNIFSSSPTWFKINSVLEEFKNSQTERVYPFNVRGGLLMSAQQSLTQSCTNNQTHVVIIFLNKQWKKNGYGDLIVFDESGEITKAVVPKLGRTVFIQCPSNYLIHSPANNVPNRLYFFEIATTTSKQLFEKQKLDQHKMISMRDMSFARRFAEFDPSKSINMDREDTLRSLDLSRFVTHTYTVAEGKNILVFDNLLPKQDVERLFDLMHHGVYHDLPAEDNSSDNVQWVLGVETLPFLQTHLWTLVKRVVTYASGQSGFYPYDVSCNHIQTFDHTKIHQDCEVEENEFTFMVYLNPNWTLNHYGETVFLDDQGEIVAVVAPKHGRIVIFHGTIPHSARPPSPLFQGARFTFVVKMSSSKEKAFAKHLQNELNDDDDNVKKEKDDEHSTSPERELRKQFFEAEERHSNELDLETPATKQEMEMLEKQISQNLAGI